MFGETVFQLLALLLVVSAGPMVIILISTYPRNGL